MSDVLARFLASATLGVLRVGLPSGDLVELLGSALARHTVEGSEREVWKYGPLELTVANNRVAALKIAILDRLPLPTPLEDVALPIPEIPLYDFIQCLEDSGVGWEIDSAYTHDRQLCILTNGGVRGFFDLDHRELQSLQA